MIFKHLRYDLFLGSLSVIVLCILMPTSASAISTDESQYALGETVHITCATIGHIFQLYDLTNSVSVGGYPCEETPNEFIFDNVGSYAVLELALNTNCDEKTYGECKALDTYFGEATFAYAIAVSSDQSQYTSSEAIVITCDSDTYVLQLYDITGGADASAPNLGVTPCESPSTTLSFDAVGGHTYAALELQGDWDCEGMDYNSCKSQFFFIAEVTFIFNGALNEDELRLRSYPPEVTILSPKAQTVFSDEALIIYGATDKNDIDPTQESAMGLGKKPVSLFYSDGIGELSYDLVTAENKKLIAKDQPAQGSYRWKITDLLPGVAYRFIVDAIDNIGAIGEAVSDFFYVDFSTPEFTVSADPPATRGADVMISVDSSEDLRDAPMVSAAQEGRAPALVAMKGEGSHYEGIYKVVPGYDGVATIFVEGTDLGGNIGTTIVSGGTFAVGVNPPPAPQISFPRNNDVTASSTTSLSGTTRPNTTIVLTVNGADIYTATPDTEGNFTISNISLSKDKNRGMNTLSVSAKDILGILSEAVPIKIKFNVPPTIFFASPAADAILTGSATLAATSTDENADFLQFTYQIISAKDFVSTESASSTQNEWIRLSEVPTNRLAWDTTEVEDGKYIVRIIVDDGLAKAYSDIRSFTVRNTLPFFRFENGRKTVSKSSPVTIVGRALAPNLSSRPTITGVEYSLDKGKKWTIAKITGAGSSEATFSVAFPEFTKEGTYPVLWRVSDSRKLFGRTTHPIIIDTTPSRAPLISSPRAAVVGDAADENAITKGVQITLSGTAEPLSTVILGVASSSRTMKAAIDGRFAFRDVSLARGPNAFSLSASDIAGNLSTTTTLNLIYDNPPQIIFLEPKSARGLKGNARILWHITDSDGDMIQGIELKFRRGAGAFQSLPIDPTATSFNWDVSGLSEAADYELVLQAGDGFTTTNETIGFAIDTTPPSLASFTLEENLIGKSGVLEGQGEARDTLSGIEYVEYALSEKGVPLSDSTEWFVGLITRGFLQNTASYSIKQESQLTDGIYSMSVRAVDGAGNVSSELSEDVTVDTVPPRIGSFGMVEGVLQITPDRDGALVIYPGKEESFRVSLEGDTKSASLTIGEHVLPLQLDIRSGLWQTTVPALEGGKPVSILITAEDGLGNTVEKNPLGEIGFVNRGTVRDEGGAAMKGIPIAISTLDENSQEYVPLSSAQNIMTADDGTYELALPQGTYRLTARTRGYAAVEHMLTLERPAFIGESFTLKKFKGIRGLFNRLLDYWNYSL